MPRAVLPGCAYAAKAGMPRAVLPGCAYAAEAGMPRAVFPGMCLCCGGPDAESSISRDVLMLRRPGCQEQYFQGRAFVAKAGMINHLPIVLKTMLNSYIVSCTLCAAACEISTTEKKGLWQKQKMPRPKLVEA